jgi:hypothetical protein
MHFPIDLDDEFVPGAIEIDDIVIERLLMQHGTIKVLKEL